MKNIMKSWYAYFKKDERGLTLVELLAVVVILAIVGLIAFVSVGNIIENSRKDAHIANAMQIIHGAELHVASGGSLDIQGEAGGSGINRSEIDTIPNDIVDPWRNSDNIGGTMANYADTFILNYNKDTKTFTISSRYKKCKFENATKTELAQEGRDICKQNAT